MYRKIIYQKYLTSLTPIEEIEKIFSTPMKFQKEIIDVLPKDKEAKIIDLGCGYGRLLNSLKSMGYKNLYGVEIGKEESQFLKHKGFNIINTDIIEFLKSNKEKFDVIFMMDVLEHFKKDEIVEILPLLKRMQKGSIIIRVPNAEAIFKGSIMYGDFTHETFFTKRSFIQLFKVFGFEDVRVYPAYSFSDTLKGKVKKAIYLSYVKWYKFLLSLDNPASVEYFIPTQNLLGIVK